MLQTRVNAGGHSAQCGRNLVWSHGQSSTGEKEGRKCVFSLFFLIHLGCTSCWVSRQMILGGSSWAQGWLFFAQRLLEGSYWSALSLRQGARPCQLWPEAHQATKPSDPFEFRNEAPCFLQWLCQMNDQISKVILNLEEACWGDVRFCSMTEQTGNSCFLGGNDWPLGCGWLTSAHVGGLVQSASPTLLLRFVHFLPLSQLQSASGPSSSCRDSGRGPRPVFHLWVLLLQSRPLKNVSWTLTVIFLQSSYLGSTPFSLLSPLEFPWDIFRHHSLSMSLNLSHTLPFIVALGYISNLPSSLPIFPSAMSNQIFNSSTEFFI